MQRCRKKLGNDAWGVALFTFYCNFVRIHKTLPVTPAMAAGVTDKLWEMMEDWEAKLAERKKLTAVSPRGAWASTWKVLPPYV
jgi:hypothetical protein